VSLPAGIVSLSRKHASLEFCDGRGIVLSHLDTSPTFCNGELVSTSVVLAHGDEIGLGGATTRGPTFETVVFRANLSALGTLRLSDADRMPPPPARAPVAVGAETAVAAAATAEATEASAGGATAAGDKRERGERGGKHSKKARLAAGDGAGGDALTSLPAEDAVHAQHSALVEPLKGDAKRYARRMLEQLGIARSRLLSAIDDAASDPSTALEGLGRVAHGCSGALRDVADEIDRSHRRARVDAERADARHVQHDARQGSNGPAASHAGGKGGGGKGGGSKGGGRGGKGGSKFGVAAVAAMRNRGRGGRW
jgi:hypothetical protein